MWLGCWIQGVKEICNKYNIDINTIDIYKKNQLKKEMKNRINYELTKEIVERSQHKTKLRFIKEYSQKEYLKKLDFNNCIMMIKIRLNMIETKCNYKGNFKDNIKCEICKSEDDTTEHLLRCTNITEIQNITEKISKPDINIVKIIKQNISRRELLNYKVSVCIGDE